MMSMDKAPLHGTVSYYCYVPGHKVLLQKEEGEYEPYIVIKDNTFEHLYYELDFNRCALKSDCIQYVIYYTDKPLAEYPDWFISAYDNGDIYEEDPYGVFIMYNEHGDIVMDDGDIVLRNFKGELSYMLRHQFDKYYEIIGG